MFWILVDRVPVPAPDIESWGADFQDIDRRRVAPNSLELDAENRGATRSRTLSANC